MINYYSFSSNKFGLSLRLLVTLSHKATPCPDFPAFGLFFIFFVSKIITLFISFSPLELDGVIL